MPEKPKYKIQEIVGEPGCYYVNSLSGDGDPYLVDIFENNGCGVCTCMDFQCRCYPNWIANDKKIFDYGSSGNPHPKRTYCRHIKLVRMRFLNEMLAACYVKYRVSERN